MPARTLACVLRLMVGEWEEAFTTTVAAGGGVTLFIGVDGAPLVIVYEEAGLSIGG